MRYTHKLDKPDGNCNYFLIPDQEQCDNAENKLGQLEDLMEKYHIETIEELETLCKYVESVKEWMSIYKEKMYKIKDIEEELGIDLLTYFRIKSAESVYIKELGNDISEMLVRPSKDSIDVCYKGFVNIPECDSRLQLKDYGKTWALTKEELL